MGSEIEYLFSEEFNRLRMPGRLWMPRVTLRFAEVEGRAECVRIEIGARLGEPDPRRPVPLTTTAIRSIPFAELTNEARRKWVPALHEIAKGTFLGEPVGAETRTRAKELLRLAERSARRKRLGRPRKYDREYFEEVARVYREGYRTTGTPTVAVKEHFGVAYSTANKLVARARNEFGLLPKTVKGEPRVAPRRGRRKR